MSNDIEIVKAFKVGNKLFPDKESAEKEEMRLFVIDLVKKAAAEEDIEDSVLAVLVKLRDSKGLSKKKLQTYIDALSIEYTLL